ncbi:hypothetical protein ACQV2S_02820 [Facklamia sp. P13064]|uniref:hypothetical protein n=1 Tax=Facklamia sp. P13064 TaxID=3421953 RepID=UPI003D16DB9D
MKNNFPKIVIDATAEWTGIFKRPIPRDLQSFIIDENLIVLKRVYARFNGGKATDTYQIQSEPPLLMYARHLNPNNGLISLIPSELLENGKGFDDALLRNALATRILAMRNNRNKVKGNKIKLDTLCKEVGKTNPTYNQRRTLKDNAENILTEWKKMKFIKGYDIYKLDGSRAIEGFIIQYTPFNKALN